MVAQIPGHFIMVTGNLAFGRAIFECECGIERRFASKPPAVTAALAHHRDVSIKG